METREQWLARQRAEAAARQRAEAAARQKAEAAARQRAEAAARADQERQQNWSFQDEEQDTPATVGREEPGPGASWSWNAPRDEPASRSRPLLRALLIGAPIVVVLVLLYSAFTGTAQEKAQDKARAKPQEAADAKPELVASSAVPEQAPATPPRRTPSRRAEAPSALPPSELFNGIVGSQVDEQPEELLADNPTIAPARGWWCVCYEKTNGLPHTACRRERRACESLRQAIQKGPRGVIRGGSADAACEYVKGAYPWLKLGYRDAWRRSGHSDAPRGSAKQRRKWRNSVHAQDVCALGPTPP